MFILGQIYQNTGQFEEASRYYKAVIKKNASFEMEFNSKINLAICYVAKSGKPRLYRQEAEKRCSRMRRTRIIGTRSILRLQVSH